MRFYSLGKRQEQEKCLARLGWLVVLTAAIVSVMPVAAYATGVVVPGTMGATDLTTPWEGPLAALARSFTGPVAMALALLMIVIGVGVLMFGGDLSGWARWVAFALVAAGTLGGAGTIVGALNLEGAVIL